MSSFLKIKLFNRANSIKNSNQQTYTMFKSFVSFISEYSKFFLRSIDLFVDRFPQKIQILIIMGSYISKMEDEVSTSLQVDYQIESQPYILHKKTQQLCTLLKITAESPQEADMINQVVEQYQRTKCQSISKLRSHYKSDNTGYCSDQQNFYLVFDSQNNYTIRDELVKRKFYNTPFTDSQIEQILTTTLCGLREYDLRFQRNYDHLSLASLVIDQRTNRISLKDPWLNQQKSTTNHNASHTGIIEYPSPEKLNATYINKIAEYNESLSNLFSVGVLALELNRMQVADEIYIRKREVDYDEIKNRIRQLKTGRLKQGVECLLSSNPEERKMIYNIWGIENKQQHFLEPILFQKENNARPPSPKKTEIYNKTSKFQFPPNPNPKNSPTPILSASLQYAPSEIITIPPLELNGSHTPVFNPPSTKSRQEGSPRFAAFPAPNLSQNINQKTHSSAYNIPVFQVRPPTINSNNHSNFQPYHGSSQYQASQNNNNRSVSSVIESHPLKFQEILARQQQKSSNHQVSGLNQGKPTNYSIKFGQKSLSQNPNFPSVHLPSNPPPSISGRSNYPTYESPIKNGNTSNAQINQIKNMSPVIVTDTLKGVREATSAHVSARPQQYYEVVNTTPKIQKREQVNIKQIQIIGNQRVTKKEEKKIEPPNINVPNRKEEDSNITPQKPIIIKGKHNSTIVEVRDEDSPAHSPKSEPREEQFVIEEYETGSRYEGFKSGGMRNGRGKFFYQDGGFYQGSWRNNKMDGFGKLFYEGGKLAYEGQWHQDEFHGTGKVYNDNPAPLSGSFDYTDFEQLQDYWQYYQGTLQRDTKEGRGKIRLSNGQAFEGDFHNDRIQGFGKFHTIEGKTIQGIWRDSKLVKVINSSKG